MGDVFGNKAAVKQAREQAAREQAELNRQRGIAESQQVASLQDTLENQTNRLARVYGTKALLAGTGRTVKVG